MICGGSFPPGRTRAVHIRPSSRPSRARQTSPPCSNSATSTRSFGRPAARLLVNRSARLRSGTERPSRFNRTRRARASAKTKPEIAVRISIRTGARPIWDTIPGFFRSSRVSSCSGAPNETNAFQTNGAFSAVGATQMSRSPVARGGRELQARVRQPRGTQPSLRTTRAISKPTMRSSPRRRRAS
jgi:hypothetical protein